ncbi:hypothetical protein BOX15_Mlig017812g1 [Macrostomum lignano]|uniref:Uncharacterized protein n=1 Tax=Macrostomum lignano TaxID=282301 RepID=A0A267F1G5_9PLAT|nr:hypothetical protein BOX15_Mlig017812g1 [Macrostomum lignano]
MSSFSLAEALKKSRPHRAGQFVSPPRVLTLHNSRSEPSHMTIRRRNDDIIRLPAQPWHSPTARGICGSSSPPPTPPQPLPVSFSVDFPQRGNVNLHQYLPRNFGQQKFVLNNNSFAGGSGAMLNHTDTSGEDAKSSGTLAGLSDTISIDASISDHFLCERSDRVWHSGGNCSNSTHRNRRRSRRRGGSKRRRKPTDYDEQVDQDDSDDSPRVPEVLNASNDRKHQNYLRIKAPARKHYQHQSQQNQVIQCQQQSSSGQYQYISSSGGSEEFCDMPQQYIRSTNIAGLFANASCLADQRSPSQRSDHSEPQFGREDLKVRGHWQESLSNDDQSTTEASCTDEENKTQIAGVDSDLTALTLSRMELSSSQAAATEQKLLQQLQQKQHRSRRYGGGGGGSTTSPGSNEMSEDVSSRSHNKQLQQQQQQLPRHQIQQLHQQQSQLQQQHQQYHFDKQQQVLIQQPQQFQQQQMQQMPQQQQIQPRHQHVVMPPVLEPHQLIAAQQMMVGMNYDQPAQQNQQQTQQPTVQQPTPQFAQPQYLAQPYQLICQPSPSMYPDQSNGLTITNPIPWQQQPSNIQQQHQQQQQHFVPQALLAQLPEQQKQSLPSPKHHQHHRQRAQHDRHPHLSSSGRHPLGQNSSSSSFSLSQSQRSTRESNSARDEEIIPASDDLVHLSVISCTEAGDRSGGSGRVGGGGGVGGGNSEGEATTAPAVETEAEGEVGTTLCAETDDHRVPCSVVSTEQRQEPQQPLQQHLDKPQNHNQQPVHEESHHIHRSREQQAKQEQILSPSESQQSSRYGRLKTPEICKRDFLSMLRQNISHGRLHRRAKMKLNRRS